MNTLPAKLAGQLRAATYRRMSTDDQEYSIALQDEAILAFATRHNIVIAASYADEGKSGLDIDRRPELQRLIADVQSGALHCELILVYDVSRWGRFPDPDEAAYYEWTCKRAGYQVIYCAEPFAEDFGPLASIAKNMKRWAAADFSRGLSVKTYAGQRHRARLGRWASGTVPFGFRRAIVDESGQPQLVLEQGQRKAIKNQCIGVVLGPPREVETVREIFRLHVDEGLPSQRLAVALNDRGLAGPGGRKWKHHAINAMLKNEAYIGTLVWGKRARPLRGRTVRCPQDQWIRIENAFPSIIDRELFERAQGALCRRRGPMYTDTDLIQAARCVYERHGWLTGELLDAARDAPGVGLYLRRFKRIARLYELVGCAPPPRGGFSDPEGIARRHRYLLAIELLNRFWAIGAFATANANKNRLTVDEHVTIGLSVVRGRARIGKGHQWTVHRFALPRPDFTVVGCLDPIEDRIAAYYVIPAHVLEHQANTWIGVHGKSPLRIYRHETLFGVERLVDGELPFAEDELAD